MGWGPPDIDSQFFYLPPSSLEQATAWESGYCHTWTGRFSSTIFITIGVMFNLPWFPGLAHTISWILFLSSCLRLRSLTTICPSFGSTPMANCICKSHPNRLHPISGTNRIPLIPILFVPSKLTFLWLMLWTLPLLHPLLSQYFDSSFIPLEFYRHKLFLLLCLPKILILPPKDLFLKLSRAPDVTLSPGGRAPNTPSLLSPLFARSHKPSGPFPFGGNFSWGIHFSYNNSKSVWGFSVPQLPSQGSCPKEPYPTFAYLLPIEVFLNYRGCSLHAGFLPAINNFPLQLLQGDLGFLFIIATTILCKNRIFQLWNKFLFSFPWFKNNRQNNYARKLLYQ